MGHALSRRRRRRRASVRTEPGAKEDPRVILSNTALRMLETFQANAGRLALKRIEALKNPQNRRGSVKIQGRPANDAMFRIESGNYRIFYKRAGLDVYVVDIRHRQGAYK